MGRKILAIIAGFFIWGILSNIFDYLVQLVMSGHFEEVEFYGQVVPKPVGTFVLIVLLLLRFLYSLATGYMVAFIAKTSRMTVVWVMTAVLLAVGLGVQILYWDFMPAWFHIMFLISILVFTPMGGRIYLRG